MGPEKTCGLSCRFVVGQLVSYGPRLGRGVLGRLAARGPKFACARRFLSFSLCRSGDQGGGIRQRLADGRQAGEGDGWTVGMDDRDGNQAGYPLAELERAGGWFLSSRRLGLFFSWLGTAPEKRSCPHNGEGTGEISRFFENYVYLQS